MKNSEKNQVTFVPDSRFGIIKKEALIVALISVIQVVGITLIAYIFGKGDPAEYTYVFGFPLWFFLCFVLEIAIFAVYTLLLKYKFKDFPLTADDPAYHYEKGE